MSRSVTTETVESVKDETFKISKVDFCTKISTVKNAQYGYPVYSDISDGDFSNVEPIALQSDLENHDINVLKTVTIDDGEWFYFKDTEDSDLSGWINANAIDKTTRWFYVPLIPQMPELPTGCEITAVTMMLQHIVGKRVNKMKLARQMPRNQDPDKGFVGNPYSAKGWYIYPKGLINLVNHYTNNRAFNMTGCSVDSIKRQIDKGKPVVVWMADIDGFPNHALTVYGYDDDHLFLNDPWVNKRIKKSKAYLKEHRSKDAMRTLSYY